MNRPVMAALIACLVGLLAACATAAPATRAERMVAQVSSEIGGLLWAKTDDYGHAGEGERALELMRMTIQLDPSFEMAYSTLASFTQDLGDRRRIYRAGLEANPESALLNFEYGYFVLALWSKDAEAGIPYVRKAAAAAPDRTRKIEYLHVLGHLYRQTGQRQRSIATWEEVLRLNPDDGVAPRELARLRGSGG